MGMNFSKLKDYLDRQNKEQNEGVQTAEVDPDKFKQFIAGSNGVFQPPPPTPEDDEKRKRGIY